MKTLFPPNSPNPTEFICTHQALETPRARCGLVLNFLRPFLKTFIFGFSDPFLLSFDASQDLSQNAAHLPNFEAIGIAHVNQMSPYFGPEAP